MDFLKKLKTPTGEVVTVRKQISITVQCHECTYWGKQTGGVYEDGKAVFICPECNNPNYIKWDL